MCSASSYGMFSVVNSKYESPHWNCASSTTPGTLAPVALPFISRSDRGGAASSPPTAFSAKAWQICTCALLEPPIEGLLRPEGRQAAADEDDETHAHRRAGAAQEARGRSAGERAAGESRSDHHSLSDRFLLGIV